MPEIVGPKREGERGSSGAIAEGGYAMKRGAKRGNIFPKKILGRQLDTKCKRKREKDFTKRFHKKSLKCIFEMYGINACLFSNKNGGR